MNNVMLRGTLRDIEHSHDIGDISFSKANLISRRANGQEDIINIRFKSFCNKYKDNDEVVLTGNIRSYSYKVANDRNKVLIYVFTYFDEPQDAVDDSNVVYIDGRICKLNQLRHNRSGKDNIHFILANNLKPENNDKRLNSYIPCIAWGSVAKKISEMSVNTKLQIKGELHSREHKKVHPDGEVEFRVAHELLVTDCEVIE